MHTACEPQSLCAKRRVCLSAAAYTNVIDCIWHTPHANICLCLGLAESTSSMAAVVLGLPVYWVLTSLVQAR